MATSGSHVTPAPTPARLPYAEPLASPLFSSRRAAGRRLAESLVSCRDAQPQVLALPRGGIPVAFEVAQALGAPLAVWGARRIRVPIAPDLAVAAVAEGGLLDLELDAIAEAGLTPQGVRAAADGERAALAHQLEVLRGGKPAPDVRGHTVILVDDLIASGATARAALRSLRALRPGRIVLATPAGSTEVVRSLRRDCDDVIVLAPLERLGDPAKLYPAADPLDEATLRSLLEGTDRGGSP